jgi:hypothetical protein
MRLFDQVKDDKFCICLPRTYRLRCKSLYCSGYQHQQQRQLILLIASITGVAQITKIQSICGLIQITDCRSGNKKEWRPTAYISNCVERQTIHRKHALRMVITEILHAVVHWKKRAIIVAVSARRNLKVLVPESSH